MWFLHENADVSAEQYPKVCGFCGPCSCCPYEGLHVGVLASLYVEHHFSDLGDALVGLHNGLVGRPVGKLEVWLGLHGQTGLLKVVCVEQRRKVCLRHVGQGVHPDDEVLVELVRPNNDKSP